MSEKTEELRYRYRNAPIPGGGYATGFVFQPKVEGMIYLRTDIGGSYRFDRETQRWISLCDHVTMEDKAETYPIAIAVDQRRPGRVCIVSGIWNEPAGKFSVSEDYGESFRHYRIPVPVHGNLPGRGTGYRLIVDKREENTLYFASQTSGLWRTRDLGESWEKLAAMPEDYLTFVGQSLDGAALIVGAAGVSTKKSEDRSGAALYVSYDDGENFETLWQPEYMGPGEVPGGPKVLRGPVAQRYAVDQRFLYVTFASRCEAVYRPELGYSCDAGKVTDGHVARYEFQQVMKEGRSRTVIGAVRDVTPDWDQRCVPDYPGAVKPCLHLGFSGIDVNLKTPGLVICSTIRKSKGDSIYRSRDYGETWEEILHDLDVGVVTLRTSYMKPEYNSRHSMVHWMSDLKIDPNDANQAWFNTGSGVFRTRNLLADPVEFTDWSDGVEETVHINVYAPPSGEVLLLDILGDLGGFAFRDLEKPCENSFADAEGNRYVTCLNADYSDLDPNLIAVTPRGNWTGMTKGGLILSRDNGESFERLPMPFGLSGKLDEALHWIERPNVNSGWVAMSPDGQNLVWSVARGIRLPLDMVVASHDQGKTFRQIRVFDREGRQKMEGGFKVFSDRMNSDIFYGFGDHSDLYVSRDGGSTFWQADVQGLDQEINFTIVDCADQTEVRAESGRTGVIYFAAGEKGLWRLQYELGEEKSWGFGAGAGTSDESRASHTPGIAGENAVSERFWISGETAMKTPVVVRAERLGNPADRFYHLGLGLLRPGGDYMREEKALYVNANIGGVYGFYRSLDRGKTFQKLNNDRQCFGDINSIDGDKRVFGRFFIGTGSRGVLYGDPVE